MFITADSITLFLYLIPVCGLLYNHSYMGVITFVDLFYVHGIVRNHKYAIGKKLDFVSVSIMFSNGCHGAVKYVWLLGWQPGEFLSYFYSCNSHVITMSARNSQG